MPPGRILAERSLGTHAARALGTMRAVLVPTPGGPEAVVLGDAPAPEGGPGDVVVRVAATALNRADILQRQGSYPPPKGENRAEFWVMGAPFQLAFLSVVPGAP